MRSLPPAPVIVVVSAVGLAACSPGRTLMAAGSAVGSGVGAAAGAVGSVATGAAGAVAGAAGAVAGGGGDTAVAEGTALEGAATTAPASGPEPTPGESNRPFTTMAGATVATTGEALSASGLGAVGALSEGIAGCIDSFDPSVAAGAGFAATWTYAREGEGAVGEEEKLRAMRKSGVAASVVPGQRCTFRSNAITGAVARATARDVLDDRLGGAYTIGSPYGRTGECEGYTFDAGGVKLWMYFTDAQGGICDGSGAGVTIRLAP